MSFFIRKLNSSDRDWIRKFISKNWGSEKVVVHGMIYYPYLLPGFMAIQKKKKMGLLTYHIKEDNCEIVTINSVQSGIGIGGALIDAVKDSSRQIGCKRLWLITTNDNLNAQQFYQKRGFVIDAVHKNAVDKSRKLKPEIPLFGGNGIPIKDEIEFEMVL